MPSASLELPAQIGAPSDALSSDMAPGNAFEAVKNSFHDLLGPDVASVSVGHVGADFQSDVENIDPKITGQPETNDLLALSMMVAGQGVTGGQNDPAQPLTPANRPQSPTGLETMMGLSQAASMESKAKAGDNLLIVASEPVRVSQSDNSLEHRSPISAGFNADASLANSPTKPSANIDQSLDLNQTSKQQQASEMATFVRVLKNQGGGEAKINLHPAELGRMSISVSTDAADTKVSFVVETAQARQVIEAAMPKLKELLEQSGLSLSDSDVTEHHHEAANEKTDDRAHSRQSTELSEAQSEDGDLTLSVALDPNRLLDAYA
jgi:flagellar hook-length control protein FliK